MGGFFQLRYMMALIVAICIDAFQGLIEIVITAVFTIPGVAGAILGCAIQTGGNFASSCWLGGALGGAIHLALDFFTGGAAQGFLMSIGGGLADVLGTCIAITFGSGLIVLMIFQGMLPTYKMKGEAAGFLIAKIIPGINIAPGYTIMVWRNIMINEAQNLGGILGSIAKVAAAAGGGVAGTAAAGASAALGTNKQGMQSNSNDGTRQSYEDVNGTTAARGRVPLVDGIRGQRGRGSRQSSPAYATSAANENTPLWEAANDNALAANRAPTLRETNMASRQLMKAA